jgi:hypothetical protein
MISVTSMPKTKTNTIKKKKGRFKKKTPRAPWKKTNSIRMSFIKYLAQ